MWAEFSRRTCSVAEESHSTHNPRIGRSPGKSSATGRREVGDRNTALCPTHGALPMLSERSSSDYYTS